MLIVKSIAKEVMEPGLQAIVDCMMGAGWSRGEAMRAVRRNPAT